LTTTDFIYSGELKPLDCGHVSWKSPSNIALVKYWGKTDPQLPKNPSLSFTLSACATYTTLNYTPVKSDVNEDLAIDFEVYFEGKLKPDFKPKITSFFNRIAEYVPFVKQYSFVIHTRNTFPHSSGIASSASGMSALALAIMSLEKKLNPSMDDDHFYKKASFLARLGSGSAARSIKGAMVVWGKHADVCDSSDLFGVSFPTQTHKVFKNYHDTILLVDKGQKQVSSTLGHQLMQGHPFAVKRFEQAHKNLSELLKVLQNGDTAKFIEIVESEALTLHAMMLTSRPYFVLMQPNTLAIIHKIWKYRAETKATICFTLDAGANVHVLYPEAEKELINEFIVKELVPYCEEGQYINDRVGLGSQLV